MDNLTHLLRSLTFTRLCDCLFPACTFDHHFVFSVPAALVDPPLSTAMLFTLGNATCKPERVTSDYALFKIPMDGCGAHKIVSCGGENQFRKFYPIPFSFARLEYSLHNLIIHKPPETKHLKKFGLFYANFNFWNGRWWGKP